MALITSPLAPSPPKDADFENFGMEATAAYHDVCLLRGIWPGFFSGRHRALPTPRLG